MIPCPRLNHNVSISDDGKYQICGHMNTEQSFNSYAELKQSQWIVDLTSKFDNDVWPDECIRCQEIEKTQQPSVRKHSIKNHEIYYQENNDYIFVSGVLDNICNSACIMCSSHVSTYIGKLTKNVIVINNVDKFYEIPSEQILVFEMAGGEPSVSKSYKQVLTSLSNSTKFIRINTNGGKFIPEIIPLLDKGIDITITFSVDGTNNIFEYIRWPVKWQQFSEILEKYIELSNKYEKLHLNSWATISALNIGELANIIEWASQINVPLSYAILHDPFELDIKYTNDLTITAKQKLINSNNVELMNLAALVAIDRDNTVLLNKFIEKQDSIRNININNYFKE